MLLAINAGNTNFNFALFDGDKLLGEWKASTQAQRTADEYVVWLTQLMALDGLTRGQVTATIISTVVPQALFNLRLLCRRYFESEPLVIGENADLGIDILIDRPEDAGADRLVNAVGAGALYGGPAMVLDFGTGTTFDIIDREGNYCGGVIAPGINLSVEALYRAAAKLPRIAIERPTSVIGKDTVSAMRSGIFWGYVGLIEGLIARIREEFGEAGMKVIATGGLASLFAGSTEAFDHIDGDLTMKGLLEIHKRNVKART